MCTYIVLIQVLLALRLVRAEAEACSATSLSLAVEAASLQSLAEGALLDIKVREIAIGQQTTPSSWSLVSTVGYCSGDLEIAA